MCGKRGCDRVGLDQVMSILCDVLQNRCVNRISRSLFVPSSSPSSSPNSIYFVLSGVHNTSLFGIEPMNDTSILYGMLSIDQQNKMSGVLRLDALCDYNTLQTVLELMVGEEDMYFNNLINMLQFEVCIEIMIMIKD